MSEPTGYFFFLPSHQSVRSLPIGELGGPVREVTAEQAVTYPQLVETLRLLIGLCDHKDFSNGIVGPNGCDQGAVQAYHNYIKPARQLLYSLGEVVGDEPAETQGELTDRHGQPYSDPFSECEGGVL